MRLVAPALAAVLVLAASPTARAAEVSLPGTWYVLVHYTDENSAHPDAMRWEDRVWVMAREGGKLAWTEYPIVLFDDDSGRFERSRSGYSRVVAAWEPSADQLEEISEGLEVNRRGSRRKRLARSEDGGWTSGGKARPQAANFITYTETWSIDTSPAEGPVFTRDDVLGSASMESMSGRTRYTTEEVLAGGNELRGRFERDGTRHGTFRMLRAGVPHELEAGDRTPNEKLRDRLEQEYREGLEGGGEGP